MTGVTTLAEDEVTERHRFFVAWFTGRGPDAALEESARAFALDMWRIAPDGRVQSTEEVVAMLASARGTHAADFAIRIEIRESRALGDQLALVVYDELQSEGGHRTARRASALFGVDPGAPEGVVWRHLQETWIDPAPGAPPG
jgi:hypothetical protein